MPKENKKVILIVAALVVAATAMGLSKVPCTRVCLC
jgi:hypothetical protein